VIPKRRIAYIMSRFPGLSETFILREMIELEKQGWCLGLYPLIYQQEPVVHAEAVGWLGRAQRPGLQEVLKANFGLLFSRPRLYLSIFTRIIAGNIRSLKFLSRAVALFPKAVWMARELPINNVAHVHAHYATHPALAAWIIHQITGISYSVTVHAHDIFVDRSMLETKLREASFIAAISNFNRQYLVEHLGSWVGEKISVVHCGIDPERYIPHLLRSEAKQPFEILSVGSLRPYKGQKYLIGACAVLRSHGIPFHCRIVGEGELRTPLLEQISKLNLHDFVELVGAKTQQEVARLLSESDCYVQPSVIMSSGKMEGIPVALMEALACALPVVTTSISGISELVRHGETGWLVPPANAEALAEAVERIYNNLDEAAHLGASGRDLVLQEFDLQKNVLRLELLFGTCIPPFTDSGSASVELSRIDRRALPHSSGDDLG
jgi:colanic acid/amylovoran biosynthesis glycosyltransferase